MYKREYKYSFHPYEFLTIIQAFTKEMDTRLLEQNLECMDADLLDLESRLLELRISKQKTQTELEQSILSKIRNDRQYLRNCREAGEADILSEIVERIDKYEADNPPPTTGRIGLPQDWEKFYYELLPLINALRFAKLPLVTNGVGFPITHVEQHIFGYSNRHGHSPGCDWRKDDVEAVKVELKRNIVNIWKLMDEKRQDMQRYECRICMLSEGQMVAYSACGHVLCETCSRRVQNCPFCRHSGVNFVNKIFL